MLDNLQYSESLLLEGCADALQPGDTLMRGQYRIERYLSAGGFGITYLARNSLDRKVAIKECFPHAMCFRDKQAVQVRSDAMQNSFASVVRNFGSEARRLARLSHPNIVGVHQVFEENGTAYMVLDFVDGRTLMDVIEQDRASLTQDDIKAMLIKLLDAVAYIHENDVLHLDISPDNILLKNDGSPILIDFGAAQEAVSNATLAFSGMHVVKDGYSPQEFYLANGSQAEPADLYSLAATFYHLIMGVAPPNSQDRLMALASEELDPYKPIPPMNSGFDHFFIGAIDKALAVFPKHRLHSAIEWIELIDTLRRQKALRKRAERDLEMNNAIRALTEEVNSAIADSKKQETEKSKAQEAQRVQAENGELASSHAGADDGATQPSHQGQQTSSYDESINFGHSRRSDPADVCWNISTPLVRNSLN